MRPFEPVVEADRPGCMTAASLEEYRAARRYVVVFSAKAADEKGALTKFAEQVERVMVTAFSNSNFEPMNIGHIEGALMDLKHRSFVEEGYLHAASAIALHTRLDEIVVNRERTYYVLVLKHYLDMLERGDMCMRSVFEKMRHSNTIPGPHLMSAPFRCPGGRHVLPQFADAFEVPLHDKRCRAVRDQASRAPGVAAAAKARWDAYITRVRESCAVAPPTSFVDALCACAAPEPLAALRCTCFRSHRLTVVKGCKLSPAQKAGIQVALGGVDLAAAGIEDITVTQLMRPVEDLAFEEHFLRTLQWEPARLRPGAAGAYADEAQLYHPALSVAKAVAAGGGGGADLGQRHYPADQVTQYLRSLADMLDRSCRLAAGGAAGAGNELRQVGATLLTQAQAQALSSARDALLALDGGDRDAAARRLADERAWDDALRGLAEEQPEAWAAAEPYVRTMSALHRTTWLRLNAAPSAAVELMQRSLLAELEKSISRTMAADSRQRAARVAASGGAGPSSSGR
jgi:hypothetical protein